MVELEDFKYGGTNITALRLVDPSDEKVCSNSLERGRHSLRGISALDLHWSLFLHQGLRLGVEFLTCQQGC